MPFLKAKHQIAFVSQQTLPIILGVIVAKPQHVHLLVTEKMANVAKSLNLSLKKYGKKISLYHIHDNKHQTILNYLNKVHKACNGENVYFNLTGGTKLMAIAAREWALVQNIPVFYVDTDNKELVFLEHEWKYKPLPEAIKVHELLYGHGYEIESYIADPIPQLKRNTVQKILELVCRTPVILSQLNWCATQSKKAGILAVRCQHIETNEWNELLALCDSLKMLQRFDDQIIFASQDARHWCNGLWFEDYVASVLYKLKQENIIQSWAMSVEVHKNDIKNELDAIFTVDNRLFIIECKTAAMQKTGNTERVTPIVYKADSLNDKLGGIYAKSMICSVLPWNEIDKKRAQNAGMKVVCGKEVLDLENHLKAWIATKNTKI